MQKIKSYRIKSQNIKNKLAKYSKESILETSIKILTSGNGFEYTLPWNIFLALKWRFLQENSGTRKITTKEFSTIIHEIFNLQTDAFSISSSNDHIILSLRSMIMHQSWHQTNDSFELVSILRQQIIFCAAEKAQNYYKKSFFNMTQIELDDFYMISIYLILTLANEKNKTAQRINISDLIFNLSPIIKITTLTKYFKLLGNKFNEIGEFLKEFEYTNNPAYEYFESTPFKIKPFIIFNNEIYIIDAKVCINGIASYVTNLFKNNDNEKFKSKLGPDFERYINSIISGLTKDLLTETDIKEIYKIHNIKDTKVVDFIVTNTPRVFIDAKAIEPEDFHRTNDPDRLYEILKKSFINGVTQAQECCSALSKLPTFNSHENFAIIVTNQEFFIPDGNYLVEHIEKFRTDKKSSPQPSAIIKPQNCYFLSVYTFESMIELAFKNKVCLADILTKISAKQTESRTTRLSIAHQLQELYPNQNRTISRIKDQLHKSGEKLAALAKENNNYWLNEPEFFIRALQSFLQRIS